jgi:dipeptide/tripeptide permease
MENPREYTMEQTPGALDLGQATATRIFCGFFVVYFTSPIFFAPLVDSRLGQYRTLVISLGVYVLGCIALAISSYPSMLDRGAGLPGLLVAMALIALGGGCVSPSHHKMRAVLANFVSRKLPSGPSLLRSTKTERLDSERVQHLEVSIYNCSEREWNIQGSLDGCQLLRLRKKSS